MNEQQKAEKSAVERAQLLKRFADEIETPGYLANITLMAMDRRSRYLANLKAGFTEAQALELVK